MLPLEKRARKNVIKMNFVRKLLTKLAKAQKKHRFSMILVVFIFTVFMAFGVAKMSSRQICQRKCQTTFQFSN
jgi:predicted RND superfamily exporter protein